MKLTVTYSAVDGYRSSRTFKTHRFAKRFAVWLVGPHPEIGPGYAVADDGVGKVTVSGCTLAQLFGDGPPPPADPAAPVAPTQEPKEGDYGWRTTTILYSWVHDGAVGTEYGPVHPCPDLATAAAEIEAEWNRLYPDGDPDERFGLEAVQFTGAFWRRTSLPIQPSDDDYPF